MSTITTDTKQTVANLKKFVNKPFFALKSPNIRSFVKHVCQQIDNGEYEKTDYLEKFNKIKLIQCNSFLFVFVYKVLEAFLNLKRNEQIRNKMVFSGNSPTNQNIVLPTQEEGHSKASLKLNTLKTVLTSANMKAEWKPAIEKFKKILKGKSNADVLEEINEQDLLEDVANGKINSNNGVRIMQEQLNKNRR